MSTDARKSLGRLGERLAAEHFERLGFRVLARNHHTRFGELDLVLAGDGVLVFCEVKTCRLGRGVPWDSLHLRKRSQVRRIASIWLNQVSPRPFWETMRFDAVGVVLDAEDRLVRLDHIEGAF